MKKISLIDYKLCHQIDKELIEIYKWPLESLMEMAGLSVAQCSFDII